MKQYITHLLRVIIISSLPITIMAQEISIPDSLLTIDHIYHYTFTDYDKSQQIARNMRQRKMEQPFKLDMAEGDLNFNTGRMHQALKYYKQALKSDSVMLDDQRYMKLMHRFISCYDYLHEEKKKTECIEMLLEKAQAVGDKAMESIARFNMGKMLYYQKDKERGYQFINQAIKIMEESDYEYRKDNLIYDYNTLYIMLQLDQQFEEALKILDKLALVINDNDPQMVNMEGINRKELKTMYAHRAFVLAKLNRKKEAAEAYNNWKELGSINDKDNYLITSYLMTIGEYDEIIRLNELHENFIKQNSDTISYHMRTLKRTSGRAYEAKGDYKKAMRYFDELAVLTDSLKTREQKSAALELATVYQTIEKEAQLQQKTAEVQMRNILLISAIVIIILLIILLWRYIYYIRTIKKKNQVMVNNINQMLQYKEQKLEISESGHTTETPFSPDDTNKELFDRLESIVISRKLYLDRNLNRDDYAKLIGVDKNRFGQILKEEAHTNITGYVNNLRLEDAVRMLKENPELTIGEITEACALPNTSTFYRLFKDKFGMTPIEFREAAKKGNF